MASGNLIPRYFRRDSYLAYGVRTCPRGGGAAASRKNKISSISHHSSNYENNSLAVLLSGVACVGSSRADVNSECAWRPVQAAETTHINDEHDSTQGHT